MIYVHIKWASWRPAQGSLNLITHALNKWLTNSTQNTAEGISIEKISINKIHIHTSY